MTVQQQLKEYLIRKAKDFLENDWQVEMSNKEANEMEERTLKVLDLL